MRIVVLTGAGISAESGVPTFRDAGGLWHGHRLEDVATPTAYARNPDLVHEFYDTRRAALATVEPNAGHRALAELEAQLKEPDELLLVTQNVDDLHERAGSKNVVHMHGRLRSARCTECGVTTPWLERLGDYPECPGCGIGALRPDVVWFGELPLHMDETWYALTRADLFVAIGTSAQVHPAARFVEIAADHGARTLELNLEESAGTDLFHEARFGPATTLVPQWVAELLDEPVGH